MRAHQYRSQSKYVVGDRFEIGNPQLPKGEFTVVQVLGDGTRVLNRTNVSQRDERCRWYEMGGPGRPGIRMMEDE